MIILGIDPGTARVGWAIIHTDRSKIQSVAYGCIMTQTGLAIAPRLNHIYNEVNSIIDTYHPSVLSIEDLFFATNAKTAISVGEARGVILLAAGRRSLDVISYTPLKVKQSITGYGNAEKKQVQIMVTKILKLPKIPQPDDTADALAIALTYVYNQKMSQLLV
jgi:crossover junction endodeoxyribonuclease RuvC